MRKTTMDVVYEKKVRSHCQVTTRLQGLLKAAKTDERRQEICSAAARLVDPTGMGKEYQVMGITNKPSEKLESWPFPEPDSTGRNV
jgi:hypothetical protein